MRAWFGAVLVMLAMPAVTSAQGLSQCQFYPWLCPPPAFQTESVDSISLRIDGFHQREVVAVEPYVTSMRNPVLVTMHGVLTFKVTREGEPIRMSADVQIRRTTGTVEDETLSVVALARTQVFVDLSTEQAIAVVPVSLTFIDSGRFGPQTYGAFASGRVVGDGLATFASGDWTIQALELPR